MGEMRGTDSPTMGEVSQLVRAAIPKGPEPLSKELIAQALNSERQTHLAMAGTTTGRWGRA